MTPNATCLRCNWTWLKRTENPKQCPKCHSMQWQTPRVEPTTVILDPAVTVAMESWLRSNEEAQA